MATKGCERLLPLPCGPGKHRPVECLWTTLATIVAAHSTPTQSTTNVVEPDNPDLQAVDSSPTCFAPLSYSPLSRHSSKVGAVCVEAPVRICAGGDQRWSSLPRPLATAVYLSASWPNPNAVLRPRRGAASCDTCFPERRYTGRTPSDFHVYFRAPCDYGSKWRPRGKYS